MNQKLKITDSNKTTDDVELHLTRNRCNKPRKKKPLFPSSFDIEKEVEQSWRSRLITEIRLRKLTYDQLADMMNVSSPQVAKHMQGKAKHYHAFVEDACKVLDVSTLWIFEGIHPGDVSAPLYDEDLLRSWLLNNDYIGEREPITEYYSCTRQFKPGKRTFSWITFSSDMDDGMGMPGSLPENEIVFCDPDRPVHSAQRPTVLCVMKNGGVLLRQLRRIGQRDWLVPLNRVYQAVEYKEQDIQTLCVVIGGLRSMQPTV